METQVHITEMQGSRLKLSSLVPVPKCHHDSIIPLQCQFLEDKDLVCLVHCWSSSSLQVVDTQCCLLNESQSVHGGAQAALFPTIKEPLWTGKSYPLWFVMPFYNTFCLVSENSIPSLGWVLSTFFFSLPPLLSPFIHHLLLFLISDGVVWLYLTLSIGRGHMAILTCRTSRGAPWISTTRE